MDDIKTDAFRKAGKQTLGNFSKAAPVLGMSRDNAAREIEEEGIDREELLAQAEG